MEESPKQKSSDSTESISTDSTESVPTLSVPLKQIRTFQGDVATALTRQKESLFSIHETERLKRSSGGTIIQTVTDDSGKRKELISLILGSLFFLVIGIVGSWYTYNEFLRKTAPPTLAVPGNRFIPPQSIAFINAASSSRETIFSNIAENGLGLTPGELRHIVLRNGVGTNAPLLTSTEFFQIIGSRAPGSLIRAYEPLFMLGAIGKSLTTGQASVFAIFKLASFENAFPGMLSWEPNMAEDIGPLFSTSDSLKVIPPSSVFKDVISRNKDVRILYAPVSPGSATTSPALIYSFYDNRVLIITDSLETLRTLIDRLTQEGLSR